MGISKWKMDQKFHIYRFFEKYNQIVVELVMVRVVFRRFISLKKKTFFYLNSDFVGKNFEIVLLTSCIKLWQLQKELLINF